jgi:hypothetical protein
MGKMFSTAGTKYFIGGALSDKDGDFAEADFASISWTEIKGTTNLGQIGDSATLITSDQINTARTKKKKGTYNAGSMALVCDQDLTDPGQLALIAAGKSPNNFAFKIEATDAPVGGEPSQRLFIGLVMGTPETFEGANDARKLQANIEINSNIVLVAAEEA